MGEDATFPEPAAVCDGGDLDCGNGLLLIIRKAMDPIRPGEVLEIRSREISVRDDLPAWCRMVGHEFLGAIDHPEHTSYLVRKNPGLASSTPSGDDEDALAEDLEKARNFQWSVRVRRTHDNRFRAYARNQSFEVGQPIEFGFGEGDAPLSAVETLLTSLAACLGAGYQIHASRAGVIIDQLEVSLRGSLGNPLVFLDEEETGHPGFDRISGTVYVNADAEPDVLEALWEKTVARSPIAATLRDSVQLDLKFEVVL